MTDAQARPSTGSINNVPKSEEEQIAYCSHVCLLHALHGRCLSLTHCSNHGAHNRRLLGSDGFIQLLLEQLEAFDVNSNGLTCLGLGGRSGVLYRVHLFETGHYLVAKGFQHSDHEWLQNELAVYDRLRSLQGQFVPVCCGVIDLPHAISTGNGRQIKHLLLLSWAGHSLSALWQGESEDQTMAVQFKSQLLATYKVIHNNQVVHGDSERRNFILDKDSGRIMIVDFERSRLYDNRPPCDPEKPCQKTYRDKKGRKKLCTYCRELWVAEDALLVPSPGPSPEPTCTGTSEPKAKNEEQARENVPRKEVLGQARSSARSGKANGKTARREERGRHDIVRMHHMRTRSHYQSEPKRQDDTGA